MSCCTLRKFFLLCCLEKITFRRAIQIADTATTMNVSTPTTAPTTVESSLVLPVAVTDVVVNVACGIEDFDVVELPEC